jgi:hypothetical protein
LEPDGLGKREKLPGMSHDSLENAGRFTEHSVATRKQKCGEEMKEGDHD